MDITDITDTVDDLDDLDDVVAFPTDGLRDLAAHFENVGRAWPPETVTGRALRQECFGRAGVCRDAILAYGQRTDVVRIAQLEAENAALMGKLTELEHFASMVANGVISPA